MWAGPLSIFFSVDHMQVDINTLSNNFSYIQYFCCLAEQKMICTWGEYNHSTSLEKHMEFEWDFI